MIDRSSLLFLLALLLPLLAGAQTPALGEGITTRIFPGYEIQTRAEDGAFYPVMGWGERRPLMLTPEGVVENTRLFMRIRPKRQVNDRFLEIMAEKERSNDQALVFVFTLRAPVRMENCFAALIIEQPDGKRVAKIQMLPTLPAGEPTEARLRYSRKWVPEGERSWHFYEGTTELYTNQTEDAQVATPEQDFKYKLAMRLARAAGGSLPPEPYYVPLPSPSEELLPANARPLQLPVEFTIGADGRLQGIELANTVIEPALRQWIEEHLRRWRFFPELRGGEPTKRKVKLPLTIQ